MSAEKDPFIGKKLGQYEILEKIGQGALAAVYRAHQTALERMVAVKVLTASIDISDEFKEHFIRELNPVARLEHPHIIPVHDYGVTQDKIPYIVMRLIKGETLEQRIWGTSAGQLLPLKDVVLILVQIANALDYAHQKGVTHQNVKPSDVLLYEDSNAFLGDFGIVRLLRNATDSSVIIGTPGYMSPEQWRGETADGRVDQYALGITAYAMLTRLMPFEAETTYKIMYNHLHMTLPNAQQVRPDLPDAVQSVLEKATAKNAADRYPTTKEFALAFAMASGIATVQSTVDPRRAAPKAQPVVKKTSLGRNDPCWCGSGKKYKYCHFVSDRSTQPTTNESPLKASTVPTEQSVPKASTAPTLESFPTKEANQSRAVPQAEQQPVSVQPPAADKPAQQKPLSQLVEKSKSQTAALPPVQQAQPTAQTVPQTAPPQAPAPAISEQPKSVASSAVPKTIPQPRPTAAPSMKPMNIFISYAKKDRALMDGLAIKLEQMRHTVWFDKELEGHGGQNWWEVILSNIREADLFIFALTSHSLASAACRQEYTYAGALKKRVLPVLLLAENFAYEALPSQLQIIQVVNYDQGTNTQIGALSASLANLPAPQPLPNPLPITPPAPVSPFGALKERIEQPLLSQQQQRELVWELESMLEGDDAAKAAQLMLVFMRRADLFADVHRRLEELNTKMNVRRKRFGLF